ncbi:SH3 domain-containing protein [Erwinia psidii]|uniref:SH3 domain-containing protein n=1 Tax=Erwinia psidii TaxID=69224 RepID=A0A3N6S825_9GAMM|nr:SH3 domain-containing protein [Erwinia psidii]RQM36353.1 SH3 domain-containing protein [Erwinia psidii]
MKKKQVMADQSLDTDKSILKTRATADKKASIGNSIKQEHSGLHQDLEGCTESIEQKINSLVPHNKVTSTLLAMPDSMKSITSLAQRYKDLLPGSTATSALLASQVAMPDSMKSITSLAQRYKDLLPGSTATSALLASQVAMPDSMKSITSLAQRYKDLLPGSTEISSLIREFGLRKSEFNFISEIYKSTDNFLDNISAEDLNVIISTTSIYTRTAKGAAYIAQNTAHLNDIEPDAIAKLEEFRNKNSYIKKFRELPLTLQLVIYYFITHVFLPIIEDAMKTEVLDLFNKAGDLIIKEIPINVYMKELLANKNSDVDWDTLRDFRVVTTDNVRLRNKPSMQGEVIELIGRYSVIAVLDKSDRKWIYVQISSNGEQIYGWINRCYTKPLKIY